MYDLFPRLTFNHTIIRFQKPIILIWRGVAPVQALVSFIATTYMKCRMNSIVRREKRKRKK
jgi:hypothetical protein